MSSKYSSDFESYAMFPNGSDRRSFLRTSAGLISAPYFATAARASERVAISDQIVTACVGVGGQGRHLMKQFVKHGPIVALAEVDRTRGELGTKQLIEAGQAAPIVVDDYRRLLDRQDIDAIIVATPDHWHTKVAVEAMQAGKDVYCEKPLTLTIDEGKTLRRVASETGRVVQVGTMQRSWPGFQQAVALVREGRIGEVRRIWIAINGAKTGGPFASETPPLSLNWDRWLGQAPAVDYIHQRCHYDFRWWYEYSGGKLTDWGAHHVDIAQWAANLDDTSPVWINPLRAEHPVAMADGLALDKASYNTATSFVVECRFKNGVELRIQDAVNEPGIGKFPRGILFEGTKGRLFVNRDRVSGRAVEELSERPLPDDAIRRIYKGRTPTSHVQNFLDCVRDRAEPVSDIESHHRILTTCHLANIAMRLGRPVQWDPLTESVVGDESAQSMVARQQRAGYEVTA